LDNFDINRQWCFIHAIHMNSKELTKLAKSGATVCLCPSTEANLGDGLFSLQSYLEKGGHIAIGSDSNISINPFEELRWLEYGQRLFARKRNIATKSNHGSGNTLFDYTSLGGSLASGNNLIGRLGEGSVADLIVMDDASPMFSGHHTDTLFDALIFSGVNLPIQNVMVNGEWQVTDGKHSVFDLARHNYAKQVAHLFNSVN
jgi:formimidoylglutamate deiminase